MDIIIFLLPPFVASSEWRGIGGIVKKMQLANYRDYSPFVAPNLPEIWFIIFIKKLEQAQMLQEDFKELFKSVNNGKIEGFNAYEEMLPELMLAFSKEKLYRNPNEKISSELTLRNIKDENLKYAIRIISEVNSRSTFYVGSAKDNTRYCSLVPLFMSAFKEFNGVLYDEWDRNDSFLRHTMGHQLYDSISSYFNNRKLDIKALRARALNYKDKQIAATAWPRHTVVVNSKLKWPATSLVRHIKLQTWMANIEYRNEYMILDTMNWDNIPKPLDIQTKKLRELEF